jgi:hypothetical protein
MGILSTASQRITAWIAACAILLAALVPSVAMAVTKGNSGTSPWGEICSVSADTVSVAGKTAPQPADQAGHLKHCPFCSLHAGGAVLPPSDAVSLPAPHGAALRPALYYQSPRPLFSWAPAQSRAPPALS